VHLVPVEAHFLEELRDRLGEVSVFRVRVGFQGFVVEVGGFAQELDALLELRIGRLRIILDLQRVLVEAAGLLVRGLRVDQNLLEAGDDLEDVFLGEGPAAVLVLDLVAASLGGELAFEALAGLEEHDVRPRRGGKGQNEDDGDPGATHGKAPLA
jgi:hypothetical protein